MSSQSYKIKQKNKKPKASNSQIKSQFSQSQTIGSNDTDTDYSNFSLSNLKNNIGRRKAYTITKTDVNKLNLLTFCEHLKSSTQLSRIIIKFSEFPISSISILIKVVCEISSIISVSCSDMQSIKKFILFCDAVSDGTYIQSLEFKNAYFNAEDNIDRSFVFAKMIISNPVIVILELTYCLINDKVLKTILPSMIAIRKLNISNNNIRNNGIKMLTDFFSNSVNLEVLCIDQTGFDNSALTYISNFVFRSTSIKEMSIELNGINAWGLFSLVSHLTDYNSIRVIKCKIRKFETSVAKSILYFMMKLNTKLVLKVGNMSNHRIFYTLSRVSH